MKVFVNSSETAVFECPKCEARKSVSVASLKGKGFSINVKCSCKHVFKVDLDFRQHYRKDTSLKGVYQQVDLNLRASYEKIKDQGKSFKKPIETFIANCTVRNISFGGISLKIIGQHNIKAEEQLRVDFFLDNAKKTYICREVTVKTVRGNIIGAEFLDNIANDPDLGFYLMP